MKTIAYMKRCMLLILLSCVTHTLSSQRMETATIESSDSIYQTLAASPAGAMFEQSADSLLTVETRSCVNSFANQTVSSYLSVYGCSSLTVQNINVRSGGHLSLSAPGEVIINGSFDILLGGALDVGIASAPKPAAFNYLYDASGNRTVRQFGTTKSTMETNTTSDDSSMPDSEKTGDGESDHRATE